MVEFITIGKILENSKSLIIYCGDYIPACITLYNSLAIKSQTEHLTVNQLQLLQLLKEELKNT